MFHYSLVAGLDCCDPCRHSYGYYTDNHLPETCYERNKTCDESKRCCKGSMVEGCGCPEGTYDDGHHCQNINTSSTIPCESSVIPSTSVMPSTIAVVSSSLYETTEVIPTSSLYTPPLPSSSTFTETSQPIQSTVSESHHSLHN